MAKVAIKQPIKGSVKQAVKDALRWGMRSRPSGAVAPVLQFDFANDKSLVAAVGGITLTFTRASTATYFDSSGVLQTAATNTARFNHSHISPFTSKGILIEGARINICTFSEDMTNAAWSATDITPAQDETGLDGNTSACTLTATGANGTIYNALTASSAQHGYTAYVKRKTGTGTIWMTIDGGSTLVDITSGINSSTFTRLPGGLQTLANPEVGFRMATSGDEIIVYANQVEVGAFPSSYIPNLTTGTSTRAKEDCLYAPGSDFTFNDPTQQSIYVAFELAQAAAGNLAWIFYAESEGQTGDDPKISIYSDSGTNRVQDQYVPFSGDTGSISHNTIPLNQTNRIAVSHGPFEGSDKTRGSMNGESTLTDTSVTIESGFDEIHIGSLDGTLQLFGHVAEVRWYNTIFTAAELESLSTDGEL